MRFSDDKQTLAYHLQARPLMARIPFEGMPCSALGVRAKVFLENGSEQRPETEALWFYLGNHALLALRRKRGMQETLSASELEMVEQIFQRSNRVFLRLLYYVTVICVREARHFHGTGAAFDVKIEKEKLDKAYKFAKAINDSAEQSMQDFINKAPKDLTMGELSRVLSMIFYDKSWGGGGYGGPKWGNISDTLKNLVHGEYSPEMFCDVGFALAHNGGPIFNKGMFYTCYHSKELFQILDVQRAGMVPRFIMSSMPGQFVTGEMKTFVSDYKDVFGADAEGEIDWAEVKKAGAVGDYKHLIKNVEKTKENLIAAKVAKHVTANVEVWPPQHGAPGTIVQAMTREGLKLLTEGDKPEVQTEGQKMFGGKKSKTKVLFSHG